MTITLKYPHGDITVPCYEIEEEYLPQFLYQYVDITNEDQKNTLKSPYLYFGSPLKFNDPHDRTNQINYSFLRDEKFFLDFSILECSKYFPENTPEHCSRYARDRWNFVVREGGWDKVSPQILNHIQQRNQEELRTYGALCTSLIKNNYLMWSYYANSHKGICLEFDNKIIRKHIGPVFAGTIQYDNHPIISPIEALREDQEALRKMLFIKSKIWAHEYEYRIIKLDCEDPKIQMPDLSYIKAIYLGACISPFDKDFILELCRNHGHHIKVYKGSLAQTEKNLG